jgi:LacI family transcriptional regulator
MSVRRIAKLARVSPATVSLVLRNSPKITAETRTRVLRVAKRLNYKPNAKVTELMGQIRLAQHPQSEACFGVISFYEQARPWEKTLHLNRMYKAMEARAEVLGYRLEPFWLRAPGMTYRRMRAILDARGIKGLLCFGSPDIDEGFPQEIDQFAIVAQGLSIKTPLHRVINHAYNDTLKVLNKVYQLGYRRPGLVLGDYEDVRGGHANLSAYFGWCQQMMGTPLVMPVLRLDRVDEKPLLAWLRQYRPDAVIVVHHQETLMDLIAILRQQGSGRSPQHIGMAALSQVLQGTGLSGLEENQQLMGEWAVELLVARIMNRDFGIPDYPRIEMVEGRWVDGGSLRPRIT